MGPPESQLRPSLQFKLVKIFIKLVYIDEVKSTDILGDKIRARLFKTPIKLTQD